MKDFVSIPAKTWYLEFPQNTTIPETQPNISVEEWQLPVVDDYLALYKNIGEEYGWSQRLLMEKKQLISFLTKQHIHVYLFNIHGENAGYFEIDVSDPGKAEIVYLGLVPKFIGKGYGKALMYEAIRYASDHGKNKVWLHTCEFDHPNALDIYLKAGFVIFKEQIDEELYPASHPSVKNKRSQ